MNKVIYIIRHGQTDYNKNGIVQGSGVDSSLNEVGRLQSKQFFNHYNQKIKFDLIIHSALKRTKETVAPWIDLSQSKVLEDKRINEISWGDHEGKKGTPADAILYREIMMAWSSGNYNIGIQNGETAQDLYDRMLNFVHDLRQMDEEQILICSHGRALKCMLSTLENKPPSEMQKYNISNVGLHLVHQKGNAFEVLKFNDTSHRTSLPNHLKD